MSVPVGPGTGGVGTATAEIIVQLNTTAGDERLAWLLTNASSPLSTQAIVLATGDNTITVPAGAGLCVVRFVGMPSNQPLVKLKGVAGDTGVALSVTSATNYTAWTAFTVPAAHPQATFILNMSSIGASTPQAVLMWF